MEVERHEQRIAGERSHGQRVGPAQLPHLRPYRLPRLGPVELVGVERLDHDVARGRQRQRIVTAVHAELEYPVAEDVEVLGALVGLGRDGHLRRFDHLVRSRAGQ